MRSYSQLRETFDEYAQISGHDIETAVQSETSGKFEKALLAISKYLKYLKYRLVI